MSLLMLIMVINWWCFSILLIYLNYHQLWRGLKRWMGHIDAFWGEWKGQRGADRQNTLKIFIISLSRRDIWFRVLDIYSPPPLWMLICSIWISIHSIFGHPLNPNKYMYILLYTQPEHIYIHLMRKYVRSLNPYNIYLFGPRLVPTFVIAAIVWLLGPWVQVSIWCNLTFWWQHQPKSPRWRWQSGWHSFLILTKAWQHGFVVVIFLVGHI